MTTDVGQGSALGLFAAELRHARTAGELTQEALAEKIACSLSLVGMIETGRRIPTLDFAQRGLLQTAEYARAVLRAARPHDRDEMIEQLVAAQWTDRPSWSATIRPGSGSCRTNPSSPARSGTPT